jgi:hypothetical protein
MLAVVVPVAYGCRPDSPERREGRAAKAETRSNAAETLVPSESLRFEINAPPQVRAGEQVPVTLRVTNSGKNPFELYLRGRPVAFDIIVARASGEIVWRRLEGETVAAILQVRVLAPGESLELKDEWKQRTNGGELVEAGDYTLHGVLLTDAAKGMETGEVPLKVAAD